MSEKVKFGQLVPVTVTTYTMSQASMLGGANWPSGWTVLYALDTDGGVWWLSGTQWTQVPSPARQE